MSMFPVPSMIRCARSAPKRAVSLCCFAASSAFACVLRTFVPPAVELQARYHNGVLEVTVPLPAAKLPKKVPVQIAGEERQASAS